MKPFMIDLFCGAGGVSEGAIQSGFLPIFSSDISSDVEKTYMNRHTQLGLNQGIDSFFLRENICNLTGKTIFDNINKLKYGNIFRQGDIPLLFGGPSCQGFSMIGRREKNDPRNMLFKEYVRVISEIQPKYAVMENVVGFTSFSFCDFEGLDGQIYPNGSTAPQILREELHKIGYEILEPQILCAADYGVPQNRLRCIFIAYRNDAKQPIYPQPTVSHKLTLLNAIEDLNNGGIITHSYQQESRDGRTPTFNDAIIKDDTLKNNETPIHSDVVSERFSLYQEGENTAHLRERIANDGIDISNKQALISLFDDDNIVNKFNNKTMTTDDINILLTRKNIRSKLDRNLPSKTVITIADDYISPFADRTFSVRELARLQSFDDSFEFLGKRTSGGLKRRVEVPQYSQVGNAVPPLMAKAICDEIIKLL